MLQRRCADGKARSGILSPAFSRDLKKTQGGKKGRAHSLRHAAVTLGLLGGASLQQVQSMVRRANINTTLVCSRNLDRVSQAGEFAVDRMLGES